MTNEFWNYSTRVYALPGVADRLLALQDMHGQDVNCLLYAAWLGNQGLRLDEIHRAGVIAALGDWQAAVVGPLRGVRRALGSIEGTAEFYRDAKALELAAERRQQDTMWAYFCDSVPLDTDPDAMAANLAMMARLPQDSLVHLCRQLEGLA